MNRKTQDPDSRACTFDESRSKNAGRIDARNLPPMVTIAQISSRAPAIAPPMRIGFSSPGLERTLAIDVAALIPSSFQVDWRAKARRDGQRSGELRLFGIDFNYGASPETRTWCGADSALAERLSLIANRQDLRNHEGRDPPADAGSLCKSL